jgi:hypothetical protein
MTDRDKVAEAIAKAAGYAWEYCNRAKYRRLADAAINALDAARSEHMPTDGQILGSLVPKWP